MGKSCGGNRGGVQGTALSLFVYGDPQGLQKSLILRSESDPAVRTDFLWLGKLGIVARRILALLPLVKPDRGFKDKKDVITGTLDLANGLGDALGIRQRFVNRIAEILH